MFHVRRWLLQSFFSCSRRFHERLTTMLMCSLCSSSSMRSTWWGSMTLSQENELWDTITRKWVVSHYCNWMGCETLSQENKLSVRYYCKGMGCEWGVQGYSQRGIVAVMSWKKRAQRQSWKQDCQKSCGWVGSERARILIDTKIFRVMSEIGLTKGARIWKGESCKD